MNDAVLTIADLKVRLNFLCEETSAFFVCPEDADAGGASSGRAPETWDAEVSVSREQIEKYRSFYEEGSTDAYIESLELCQNAANALLPFHTTCFHGAAFLWQGKAWIFTAPSGTGKTTQYVLWKLLYGDEITMICGDKPFLRLRENGKIRVYTSPWRGKENMGNDISAELGGIIYLAKSPENSILRLNVQEAVRPIYMQFLSRKETGEYASEIIDIENAMLSQVPVYLLRNNGTEDSARLCHDTLLGEMNK